MPPLTWYPIYELLTRHGIDHDVANAAAKNDLRHWELHEIAAILKRVKRPCRNFCYFRDTITATHKPNSRSERWMSAPTPNLPTQWISPPRAMIERSARDGTALCINEHGQWSLRTSGYVALSHVWIEGLQRDKDFNGVSNQKVKAIFALLRSRSVQAWWV